MKNFRKRFLINKDFQLKFIAFISLIALTTLLSTYLVLVSFFHEFQSLSDQAGLASNHPFRDLLTYQQDQMNFFFVILSGINFFIILFSGIWISHRIAGPIYRIVKTLENSDKSFQKITIRPGDFFQELPKAINGALSQDKTVLVPG